MSSDRFDDLEPADRETASDLLAAFNGVRLDRPSPAIEQREDDDTAARLEQAFAAVTYSRPSPSVVDTDAAPSLVRLAPRPRGRRRTPLAWLAGAAAALLLAGAVVLWPSGSSVAWAAKPRDASAADRSDVAAACSAPLARGLGELEASGSVAVGGGDAPPAPAPDAPPTELPPLAVLDVRGDVAFAVYQDESWTVTCLLRADGDGWADQGIQVGPGSSGGTPGIVSGGGTQTVDGEALTTVTGAAPAGTARVTFRLDDGTVVRASLLGSTWAAWFPGSSRIDPSSITAYDADGSAITG